MEASVASQADLRLSPAQITHEGSTSVTRGTTRWLPRVFLLERVHALCSTCFRSLYALCVRGLAPELQAGECAFSLLTPSPRC